MGSIYCSHRRSILYYLKVQENSTVASLAYSGLESTALWGVIQQDDLGINSASSDRESVQRFSLGLGDMRLS